MIFNRNESDFNWTLFCYSAKYLFNRSLLLLYKNFFKKQSCFNFGAFYGGTPRFFCAFTSCFHHNHMLPKDRFFYLKMFTWAKKLWNCTFVKIFQVSAIEEMGLFCINFIGWWISFCYTSFAVQINIACLLKIITNQSQNVSIIGNFLWNCFLWFNLQDNVLSMMWIERD